jgi:hypothetical protein
MGVDLNTKCVVMKDGNADRADVVKQGLLHIGYDVAYWCENVARFLWNRFDGNKANYFSYGTMCRFEIVCRVFICAVFVI